MARNGSGTASLLAPLATANTVSSSTTVNSTMDDVAEMLTDSINIDGTKAWEANQSLGGFKLTSMGVGSARTDNISLGQAQDGKANWVAAGGTADVITATYSPAITALVDGQECCFRALGANTVTTPTFSPNGLTARTIVKNGGSALAVGDIAAAGHEVRLRYLLASTRWELQNPAVPSTTGLAVLASANVFTADQTISSTDAGAAVAPLLTLDRNSASPANSDILGGVVFSGRDSGAGTQTYAQIQTTITDVTAASEDATLDVLTAVAGTVAARVHVGGGLYTDGVTGGDKGAGTINATTLYQAGTAIAGAWTLITKATPSGAATTDVMDLSTYKALRITGINITPATDDVEFWIRLSSDNSTFITTSYTNKLWRGTTTSANEVNSAGTSSLVVCQNLQGGNDLGNAAGDGGLDFVVTIGSFAATQKTKMFGQIMFGDIGGNIVDGVVSGVHTPQTAMAAIRFMCSSGNHSGTIIVEGVT